MFVVNLPLKLFRATVANVDNHIGGELFLLTDPN